MMAETGQIVNGIWRIEHRVGRGTFCELYQATNQKDGSKAAVKVETAGMEGSVLKWEREVLEAIQSLGDSVPRYYWYGDLGNSTRKALVMQLLGGEDLSRMRSRQRAARGRLPLTLVCSLVNQMLDCLEGLHKCGFLHRDVKPSNFVRASNDSRTFVMIDFGLCKKYMSASGEVRPERAHAEFRGTSAYASLHTHDGRDQGRRDDLASLVYVALDLYMGGLPWTRAARARDKAEVARLKRRFMHEPERLGGDPGVLVPLAGLAQFCYGMSYAQEPDYDYFRVQLRNLAARYPPGPEDPPFSWDPPPLPSRHGGDHRGSRRGRSRKEKEEEEDLDADSGGTYSVGSASASSEGEKEVKEGGEESDLPPNNLHRLPSSASGAFSSGGFPGGGSPKGKEEGAGGGREGGGAAAADPEETRQPRRRRGGDRREGEGEGVLRRLLALRDEAGAKAGERAGKAGGQALGVARKWERVYAEMVEVGLEDEAGDLDVLELALEIPDKFKDFFETDFEQDQDFVDLQRRIYLLERRIQRIKSKPPSVISFSSFKDKTARKRLKWTKPGTSTFEVIKEHESKQNRRQKYPGVVR